MRLHPSLQSSDDAHSINFQPSPLMDAPREESLSKKNKIPRGCAPKNSIHAPGCIFCGARRREWPAFCEKLHAEFRTQIFREDGGSSYRTRERAIAGSNCSHNVQLLCLWVRIWPQVQKLAEVKRRARASRLAFSKLHRRHNSNSPLIRDNGGVKP
jgi:hypothetical protein